MCFYFPWEKKTRWWQGRERERRDQGPWIVKGVSNNHASQPNLLGFKEDILIEQGGLVPPRTHYAIFFVA